jgi:diguanylate cyclase (GGDEF)-like protein
MAEKNNVLIVDDDPDKLQLLRVALEMGGYNVITASDGAEGLAAVEGYQPDLIITDVMMPNMDGYELARRVRANPQTRFIPIIIQTATRNTLQDAQRSAEVGALGYITDPADIDLLLARAQTLLDFKNYLDTVEDAAFTDYLTGVANSRRFERQLEREVARVHRYLHPCCLLLLEIDSLSKFSETYGRSAADEALRNLAKVLMAGTRGIDTAARLDNSSVFAVLIPETDLNGGLEVAERIRQDFQTKVIPGAGKSLTLSLGIAVCSSEEQYEQEFFEAAALALAKDKKKKMKENGL